MHILRTSRRPQNRVVIRNAAKAGALRTPAAYLRLFKKTDGSFRHGNKIPCHAPLSHGEHAALLRFNRTAGAEIIQALQACLLPAFQSGFSREMQLPGIQLVFSDLPYSFISIVKSALSSGSGMRYFSARAGPQEFEPTPAILLSIQITLLPDFSSS